MFKYLLRQGRERLIKATKHVLLGPLLVLIVREGGLLGMTAKIILVILCRYTMAVKRFLDMAIIIIKEAETRRKAGSKTFQTRTMTF